MNFFSYILVRFTFSSQFIPSIAYLFVNLYFAGMSLVDLITNMPGPRYRAIIEVISQEILSGRLSARDRLPTHRDLARQVGIDVGTASRAYAELRRLGLISGVVGRGTFVSELVRDAPASISSPAETNHFVDLSHNFPFGAPANQRITGVLNQLISASVSDSVMTYQLDLGQPEHREAGRLWLDFQGLADPDGETAVTSGAQHGLLLALSAQTRPGDVVMTESVTYFGLKSAAALLGLEFEAVEIDEEGLVPESLERVCLQTNAKVLCCSPTLHNPTSSLMPESRRKEIVRICEKHNVHIIEDDVYGYLIEPRIAPICAMAPHITTYVTSLSKCIGPGLRIGFIRFPRENAEKISLSMRATTLMASPVMAELSARLIRDGTIYDVANDQRQDIALRQEIVKQHLGKFAIQHHPSSFHLWLHMANGWTSREFANEVRRCGVGVAPGEIFAVSPHNRPNSVRLSISAAKDIHQLHHALSTISDILSAPPHAVVPPL